VKQSKINLNDTIRIKLTDLGKDIYYHQHDELNEYLKTKGVSPFEPKMPKVDADGFTSMQLWCFIELYRSHIGMTKPNVIEPLDIYFE
jgi:hypothetical protein